MNAIQPPPLRNVPVVLIIRDGWGRNPRPEHDAYNAVKLARTPVADWLEATFPHTLIKTSGEDVGLPDGTMGNSEVGHQNIGAGRIVYQESVRITKAIRDGELAHNTALVSAINAAKATGNAVHLISICSDAGVHGLLEHLFGCLKLCAQLQAPRVYVHCVTDGRDTGPFTGKGYVAKVQEMCVELGVGAIASVIGRYWAMDRDNRWERVARAYACLTGRDLAKFEVALSSSPTEAVQQYYDNPMSATQNGDEFVTPTLIGADAHDAHNRRISDGDAVIFVNYRGDRPRELTRAFVMPDFYGHVKPSPDTGEPGFDRGSKLNLHFVTMTAYEVELSQWVGVAFPKPPKMTNIGGEYIASLGLSQFRCAETEKFPHVTFFFNDYRDEPFPGEHREIIQSPRVATYDMQPEMSAQGVCDAVLRRIAAPDGEPFIIVNFANPDMVGHTGSLPATVKACEVVDECVGRIVNATLAKGGACIVTADHGNAEQMWDPTCNAPHTAHTVYDVPLIIAGDQFKGATLRPGRLADIMPTMLAIAGLPKPIDMTGESLLIA